MKRLPLMLALGVMGLGGITAAHAQSYGGDDYGDPGFYGAIGYYDVAPKSDNGVLAGTFNTDIDSDAKPTLTLGYRFMNGWSAELWLPISKFEHDVKLNGGKAATIEHMPTLLTGQYHFMPDSAWQPFIGLGYGWVSVSDEKTVGPLTGTNLDVDDDSGFVAQVGMDFYATSNLFIRADAKYFKWSSDVKLNGAGIGAVEVNPWIYGVSVGYRF